MDLRSCLDQCSLALLKQIAAAHSVPVAEPVARGEVVELIAGRLLAPGYLHQSVARLDDAARAALARVATEGGQARGFALERDLRARGGDPEQVDPRALLARLAGLGLLYRVFQASGPERGELYVLPTELHALFPTSPPPPPSPPTPVNDPTEVRACPPVFILFALASFLRRWQQRTGRRTEAGGQLPALEQETTELVPELPGRSARERWTLFAHLAVRLGLLSRDEGGLELTDAFEEWLGSGGAAAHRLWDAYVGSERWNDLERAGSGVERFAGRTVEPRAARATVLGVLGALPVGEWLLAADVERVVRERAPDFLREGFDAASSRLVDLTSGEVLAGAPSWERVERPTVEYILAGPLHWLGALEWGLGPDGWDRLRITERASEWLAGSDPALEDGPDPMTLAEDGRLALPASGDVPLAWQLEPYVLLERRGPPSVYALTRAAFAGGLAAGGSARELRELLERATGGPLPVAVRSALARWDARAGRFKLRPLVALLADDEAELTDVLQRLEGSGLVGERLGPKAVTVSPARAPDLASALERLGHLPELDAAIRLVAGRRAYATLVDQQVLEALHFYIRLVRALDPSLSAEMPHAERLLRRLEQALGPISAGRNARRARTAARRLRSGSARPRRQSQEDVAAGSEEAV